MNTFKAIIVIFTCENFEIKIDLMILNKHFYLPILIKKERKDIIIKMRTKENLFIKISFYLIINFYYLFFFIFKLLSFFSQFLLIN
jgi:hypothetical protein